MLIEFMVVEVVKKLLVRLGMINEIPEGSFLIYEKFIVLHL